MPNYDIKPDMSKQADQISNDEHHSLLSEIVALCKPRVIELLITTALPAMFLAAQDFPQPKEIFGVLIGGTLAAGSANAINSILERDRDLNMHRTKHRPMPQKRLTTRFAWILAISCQIASVIIVGVLANYVAALYTLAASFVYVFIYTIWLKPRTDQNIVIGGAAGAFPVIIGYSAVSGSTTIFAWLMFLVVFFWTPAHFWALSIFHENDYRLGGFPMMPITRGIKSTVKQMFIYSILTVATSLTLILHDELNWIYALSALILGFWLIYECAFLVLKREEIHRSRYMRFFHITNAYLALLFIAIAIDSVI